MARLQTDDAVRSKLLGLIRKEEQRVLDSFLIQKRLAVMELARAMEDFAVRLALRSEERAVDPDLNDLYLKGWNKALDLFVDESCGGEGVLLTPSTEDLQEWADSVLQHCGRIRQCEMVMRLWNVGLVEPLEAGDGEIRFGIVSEKAGVEKLEREEFSRLGELLAEHQKPERESLLAKQGQIARSMVDLVRPWREHYIAYDTTPEIDDFFEDMGILHARSLRGQDSFPGDALFGGQEFDLYRAAAGILIGITLKHRHFCFALLNKHPEIHPRNILASPRPTEALARVLEVLLEVDRGAAEQALQMLVLTPENKHYHCADSAAGYHAPLIAVGREDVVLSSLGCLGSSFAFMLGELRRRYPGDWDRATNLREAMFRKELYTAFSASRMLTIDRSVLLRTNGKTATDVDALVLDRRSGTLGLFQLKWQDFFGDSMRQRESRKKNFFEGANYWVGAVDRWARGKALTEVGENLGMDRNDAGRIRRLRLFVISRNFSGEDASDERAAWGLWPQVVRLMVERLDPKDPIDGLFKALKEDAPALRLPSSGYGEPSQLKFDDMLISLEFPKTA